jgi:predicted CXXCH cytochrome family protein
MKPVTAGLGTAMVFIASGLWALSVQSDGFPHADHAGLFPLCESCHGGIETGSDADYFPPPDRCTPCHDGVREDSVDWQEPSRTPSNLDYAHSEHARLVVEEGDSADCAACHREPGSTVRMAVVRAAPETCLACHADDAGDHLSELRDCRSCHVPLTMATRLATDRISEFPTPESHEREDFISSHDPETDQGAAACATCHALESCTRCHLNGATLTAVASLESDPRVATIVASKSPEYPEPDTHDGFEWSWQHGEVALGDDTGCANCHAQDSCSLCHEASQAQEIATLPALQQEDPRGVRLSEDPTVHDAGFMMSHQASATANGDACGSCHSMPFCESCHDGPDKPRYHFGNFLQMHAPEAWGAETECATCHNPDVFCRGCHTGLGLGSEGRLDVAYHTDRPFWLFGHGGPARQGLESCRTCHSQADCTQCHAALGAWRINPHGPGFEAERLAEANPSSCLICHRTGIPPT